MLLDLAPTDSFQGAWKGFKSPEKRKKSGPDVVSHEKSQTVALKTPQTSNPLKPPQPLCLPNPGSLMVREG